VDVAAHIATLAFGYVLGCFCTGYYVVRWRVGEDIRLYGSGNVGAKNVGRRLGGVWFGVVFAADVAKGAAAVAAAQYMGLGLLAQAGCMFAVLCGHLWPVQLGFRGGKGIATFSGAALVFDYQYFFCLLFLSVVFLIALRRFTLSGLVALALTPFVGWALSRWLGWTWDRAWQETLGLSLASALTVAAHWRNIREMLAPAGQRLAADDR